MQRAIGLAPLTHLELTPPQMVRSAAKNGFDFVGMRVIPATPQEPHHSLAIGSAMLREALSVLRDTGLQVLDVEIFRLLPDTDLSSFESALAAGAALGARHALVSGQDTRADRLAENFARFCELARGYGLSAQIEPTPWVAVATIAEAARLIARTGNPDAGVVLDTLHFDRIGGSAADIRALDPRLFRYFQLCDAPAARPKDLETMLFQARCERQIPGDGGLDLRAVVHALPKDIPISLEIPMHAWARTADAATRTQAMLVHTRRWLAQVGNA